MPEDKSLHPPGVEANHQPELTPPSTCALFNLRNRWITTTGVPVDGLATWAPDDPAFYRQRAALVAENGYAAATLQGNAR